MGASEGHVVGAFRYDAATQRWSWSEELYAMHGFEPGEVTPTNELMLAHHAREDSPSVVEQVRAAVAARRPFCVRHRLVDARQRVRNVVAVGEGVPTDDGHVAQLWGYLVDQTTYLDTLIAAETRDAVAGSARSRAVIEQAKGALMVTYGIDEAVAFRLLVGHSQRRNIRLRELAAGMVDWLAAADSPESPSRRISAFFESLTDSPGHASDLP